MDYIRLSPQNLESEHICCAISNAKDPQVIAKSSDSPKGSARVWYF